MNNIGVVAEVFQKFKYKESSILTKLKELDKRLISRDFVTSCSNCEFSGKKLTNGTMEILQHDNAASRNTSFMKELNIAERQLRLMSCFCPTENYLQTCRSKFLKLKTSS